jgi:hypothetical protein
MLTELLHGEERKVWGDGGYQGQTEVIPQAAPKAQDMTCKRTRFKNDRSVTTQEAPEQVQRADQGGACVPYPEAGLRFRQSRDTAASRRTIAGCAQTAPW